MQYGRRLLESRPVLTPRAGRFADRDQPRADGRAWRGRYRFSGTRERASFAMIYVPAGRPFSVRKGTVSGERMKAWWFNPRTGEATDLGEHTTGEVQRFTPPQLGEELDWVLVLDAVESRVWSAGGQGERAIESAPT